MGVVPFFWWSLTLLLSHCLLFAWSYRPSEINESMDLDSLHDPDWLELVYESNSLSGSSSNQTLGSIDDCVGLQHVDLINHTFPHEDRHSSFTFTSSGL